MQRFVRCLLACACIGLVALPAQAQADVKSILDKAAKAHGGLDKLGKQTAAHVKTKGKLEILGGAEFTQESWAQENPIRFKEMMELDVMGMKIPVTTVFDGQKIWVNANGTTMELDQEVYGKEFKEAGHLMKVMRLAFVGDKDTEASLLGEVMVEGKPAVGVRLTTKGFRDVSIYFDKESGLVTKVDRQVYDPMAGAEVNEERIIKEYQDLKGTKAAKKLLVNRDGKKFMELEVLEVKSLDKIDDAEFAKP